MLTITMMIQKADDGQFSWVPANPPQTQAREQSLEPEGCSEEEQLHQPPGHPLTPQPLPELQRLCLCDGADATTSRWLRDQKGQRAGTC